MCGRYTLISLADFVDIFPWIRGLEQEYPPRFNIAPSQLAPVATNRPQPQLELFKWGLVPSWAKDPAIGNRMINARAETLMEKPSFRTALKRRRCLVPADSFYEWKLNPDGKTKTPMRMRLRSDKPFAFAGLWEHWHGDEGSELLTFTIITTSPNELLKDIHNRMPVILTEEAARKWLSPGEADPVQMHAFLQTLPSELMMAEAVSKTVNNPANDSPQCIVPL
jgi:putative SOS response-associated peptidase YedK